MEFSTWEFKRSNYNLEELGGESTIKWWTWILPSCHLKAEGLGDSPSPRLFHDGTTQGDLELGEAHLPFRCKEISLTGHNFFCRKTISIKKKFRTYRKPNHFEGSSFYFTVPSNSSAPNFQKQKELESEHSYLIYLIWVTITHCRTFGEFRRWRQH